MSCQPHNIALLGSYPDAQKHVNAHGRFSIFSKITKGSITNLPTLLYWGVLSGTQQWQLIGDIKTIVKFEYSPTDYI